MLCNKIPGQKRQCSLEGESLDYDQYLAVNIGNVRTAVKTVNHHEGFWLTGKNRNLNVAAGHSHKQRGCFILWNIVRSPTV